MQTILISTVFLKNNSMLTDMDIQTVSDVIDSPFRKAIIIMHRTQVLFRIIFLNTRYLLAYYYSNQINKKKINKKNRSDTKSFS